MSSCGLVEKQHVHLDELVRAHGRRFLARSGLLCLRSLTTHDTAGSGQIGIAKMKEHQKMSRLVPRSQAKQRVVKLVAAM